MAWIRPAQRRPPAGARPHSPQGRARTRSRAARGAPVVLAPALLLLAALAAQAPHAEVAPRPSGAARPVLVVDVKGAIGVGTAEFIARTVERARKDEARLVVIRLDTPGGLVSATREIISTMLASPVPIAVYIAPAGARAASAGTYMAYAAHVTAMAPGTHLGAATPIAMGSPLPARDTDKDKDKDKRDGDKDGMTAAERKMVNDAVAYLRALAELRGRNADWAERAVRTAATLTSTAAEKEKVVDLLAGDVRDLLRKIDGRTVTVSGSERRLETKDAPTLEIEPDWRIKVMSVIGDPTVAYLLLLIGFYGIIFELWNPGAVVPGVIGGVSLLLALGGLSILPVSYAGLGLVVLGLALLTAEAFTPGVGVLGVGGLLAFVAGSVLLFDPDAARGVEFGVAWPAVAGAALATALFFAFGLGMAVRARRRPVATGRERMIGSPGVVLRWEGGRGAVRVQGEVWSARAAAPLAPGDRVRVAGLEGLTVTVEPRREES
jgi:membrane-bound serine protease (ClpP class)